MIKIIKRFFAYAAATAVAVSIPNISAFAINPIFEEYEIIYENTYDGGFNAILNTYDKVEYSGVTKYEKAGTYGKVSYRPGEWNGTDDDYLVMKDSAGPGGSSGINSKLSYIFDEPISSGILSYSFDVGRGDRTMAGGGSDYSMVNLNTLQEDGITQNNYPQYVLYIYSKYTGENGDIPDGIFKYPAANLGGWGAGEVGSYKVGEIHHVQQVLDFDKHKTYTYLDDELINATGMPDNYSVKDINFKMSKITGYFDNLKIELLNEIPTMELVTEPFIFFAGDKSVDLEFSDVMDEGSFSTSSFTVTKDGVNVELSDAKLINDKKVRLYFGEDTTAGTYEITVEDIAAVSGAKLFSASVTATAYAPLAELTGRTTIFEDNFDEYTSALNGTTVDKIYGTITYGTASANFMKTEYGGVGEKDSAFINRNTNYNYRFKKPVTKGNIIYSFKASRMDTLPTSTGSLENQSAYAFFNLTELADWWKVGPKLSFRFVDANSAYGDALILGAEDDVWASSPSAYVPYEKNTIYEIVQRVDLDGNLVYTYIDGKLIGEPKSFTEDLSNIVVIFSKALRHFDDFEIEYVDKMPLEIGSVSAEDNTVMITMSDAISNIGSTECEIINALTGQSDKGVAAKSGSLRIAVQPTSMQLEDGGIYLVKLPKVESLSGAVLSDNEVVVSKGSGKYLTDFSLIDCTGARNYLADKNPAEVNKLEFAISESADIDEVKSGITVTDSNGNSIPIKSVSSSGDKYIAVLDSYLSGNSRYTVSFASGLDREYAVEFVTREGKVAVSDCTFKKNGNVITDLSGISDGDTVTVSFGIVKTVPETRSVMLSYSLWNGLDMSDWDYKQVTLGADEQVKTDSFTVTVDSVNNARLKCFMWKAPGEITPLSGVYELKESISAQSAGEI